MVRIAPNWMVPTLYFCEETPKNMISNPNKYKLYLAWTTPKDYVFRKWLLDYGFVKNCYGYVRFLGLFIQIINLKSVSKQNNK